MPATATPPATVAELAAAWQEARQTARACAVLFESAAIEAVSATYAAARRRDDAAALEEATAAVAALEAARREMDAAGAAAADAAAAWSAAYLTT